MRLTCILVVLQHHWNYTMMLQKVKEKEFKATFEIKTKALYDKLPFAFDMMGEILTESCLDDTKRMKEILAMLKSRLLMKFQVFRAYNGSTSCIVLCISVSET